MGKLGSNLVLLMLILLKELTVMSQGDINSVKIGNQVWMAENLNVDHYRNGDPISTGLSNAQWESTAQGAYAIYNDDPFNEKIYGKLYNWYAVIDSRGLCPTGWHVPSDSEWISLENYLGGSDVAGGKLKSTSVWKTYNTRATNHSAFNALPGGLRSTNDSYYGIDSYGYFWSSTEVGGGGVWYRLLFYGNSGVLRVYSAKEEGFSVRCVKD